MLGVTEDVEEEIVEGEEIGDEGNEVVHDGEVVEDGLASGVVVGARDRAPDAVDPALAVAAEALPNVCCHL